MIVPLFFQKKKQLKNRKTYLTKESKNVSDNAELCRIFNNYFSEILSNLKLPSLVNNSAVGSNASSNPLSIAIKIFDQHPSIINIKKKTFDPALSFKKTSSTEVEKVINYLSIVKDCQKDDILTKVIKMNKDVFAGFVANDLNNCANKDVFSDDLMYA